jgi:hypothetical protein
LAGVISPAHRHGPAGRPRGLAARIFQLCLCGLAVVAFPNRLGSDPIAPLTVFFYSPETNINNFTALKGEFDTYLASHGNHKFQPFEKREDFERFLAERRRGAFLLSSWHYARLPDKAAWEPVLVGVAKDKITQKHLLYARKAVADLKDLQGATIATAGTEEFTRELLRQMAAMQPELADSLKLLPVPKDSDALRAVGLGIVKAAIVTERGAENLKQAAPRQFEAFHALAAGKESLLPVVVVPAQSDAQLRGLTEVLAQMGDGEEGRLRLKLLGLESLKELEEAQRKRLR